MSYWTCDKYKQFYSLPQLKQIKNISYGASRDLIRENNAGHDNGRLESAHLLNSDERCLTPISDFYSESDLGTPDFLSEESDSSTGSILRQSTIDATNLLAQEWERIERTLYEENGEKSNRPEIIEECNQWKTLHPQLRIIGKAIKLPQKKISCRPIEHDEIIAIDYNDTETCWDSDERLSQSSSDVTPCNSPRESISENLHQLKLSREKVKYYTPGEFPPSFSNFLQITPARVHSPLVKKHTSILRSELASSKWMKDTSDDRNSAKSFASTNSRSSAAFVSATGSHRHSENRVSTATHSDLGRLEPIPNFLQQVSYTRAPVINFRKVSLPPLLLEEEKRSTVSSSSRRCPKQRSSSKYHHVEKNKHGTEKP